VCHIGASATEGDQTMSLEMFILIGIILCMSIVAYDEWSKS
jgi:hypothetical protein